MEYNEDHEKTYGGNPYTIAHNYNVVNIPPVPTAPSQIDELNATIEKAKERMSNLQEQYAKAVELLARTKNSVKDVLAEIHRDGDIQTEVAEKILEAIGLDSKVTKVVSGTISFEGEIEVSIFDNIEHAYTYNASVVDLSLEYDYQDVFNLSYDVEDIDLS